MTGFVGSKAVRIAGVVVLAFGLGAGIVLGMRPGDDGTDRQANFRRAQLAGMGVVLRSYGAEDASALADFLTANPTDEVNAELMFIPLSLGNVYLNAFELRHSPPDLERALEQLELVAGQDGAWTGRRGAGSVIAYLQISLNRVGRECDVGVLAGRIADLKARVDQITLSQAQSRAVVELSSPDSPAEDAVDDAALLAAAANFLPDGPDREGWLEQSRVLVARGLSGCPTSMTLLVASQGALSFALTGKAVPDEFQSIPPFRISNRGSDSCPGVAWWVLPTSTDTSERIGERLSTSLVNSRTVAVTLTEHFLWNYSGGCIDDLAM